MQVSGQVLGFKACNCKFTVFAVFIFRFLCTVVLWAFTSVLQVVFFCFFCFVFLFVFLFCFYSVAIQQLNIQCEKQVVNVCV